MDHRTTYRVVGIMSDGTRIVLWKHLRHADARQLRSAWRNKLYEDVIVEQELVMESEPGSPPRGDESDESSALADKPFG